MQLRPGDTFARQYEILGHLGSGGSADVYLAQNVHIGQRVAIKVLTKERRGARERFIQEGRVLAMLQSPHTVKLLAFGDTEEGFLFMVFEYVDGRPLDDVLLDGPLSVDRTLRLLRQVLVSLAEAHQLAIVHRDLKPANIYVDEGGNARVLDFGIAKLLHDATGGNLTVEGTIVGTPRFLAPELIRGEPVTPRADVYALGLCAYEMLFGRPANDGVGGEAIARQMFARYSFDAAPTTPDVRRWLNSLVAHDPEDRPRDGADALRRLTEIDTASTGTWKVPRRVRVGVATNKDDGPDFALVDPQAMLFAVLADERNDWSSDRIAAGCGGALHHCFQTAIAAARSENRRRMLTDVLDEAFDAANAWLDGHGSMRVSCTAVAIADTGERYCACIGHVGCTRLFLGRAGRVHAVTLVAPREVAAADVEPLDPGQESADGTVFVPLGAAALGSHAMPKFALGVVPSVRPDLLELDLSAGDTLVICTPTVFAMERNATVRHAEDLIAPLLAHDDPQAIADALVLLGRGRLRRDVVVLRL